MGKLKALPPRLSAAPQRIGFAPNTEAARTNTLRHLYHTKRWKDLRQATLMRDLYTCQMCGRVSEQGMVIDHITPHRGEPALFWNEANLQVLCASPCHNQHKQKQEQSLPQGVWY